MFKCCALFGNFTDDSPTLSTSNLHSNLSMFFGVLFCFFFPELLSNSLFTVRHILAGFMSKSNQWPIGREKAYLKMFPNV